MFGNSVLVGLCVFLVSSGSGELFNIDLASYSTDNQEFKQFYQLTESFNQLQLINIKDVDFFIVQVHSYIHNVTLSYNSAENDLFEVSGTNIGLVYEYTGKTATFSLEKRGLSLITDVLIAIIMYDKKDPIPGGCNLTFENKIAPYQVVSYTDEVITVDSQAPSRGDSSCNENYIQVDMYHLFLKEYQHNQSDYFEGILKMLTVDKIQKHGRKVKSDEGFFKYRRLFSAYRGTGEVFAIVATYRNKSSAYVPAVSFACDLGNWGESCAGPVTDHWKYICATLLIFGIFICFFGHKFFKCALYVIGFSFGVFLTFILLTIEGHLSCEEKTLTSMALGIVYGVIWLVIWWHFGVPLLSVSLTFILSAFLVASIVFYGGLADVNLFSDDVNFWVTFTCIICATLIILTASAHHGNMICSSLLGSYACITAFNYYLGGNLQYILINTYRRITVKNFNFAVIDPPFQVVDFIHVLFWAFLLIFGTAFQWREQRGKPPFPSNRNVVFSSTVDERTRLLHSNEPQYV